MSSRTVTTEVVKDAVTFPRRRLGEPRDMSSEEFDRWLAAEKAVAWDELARVVFPLYEAAEAVLLAGADKEALFKPLAKLAAQMNPYREVTG